MKQDATCADGELRQGGAWQWTERRCQRLGVGERRRGPGAGVSQVQRMRSCGRAHNRRHPSSDDDGGDDGGGDDGGDWPTPPDPGGGDDGAGPPFDGDQDWW